MDSRLRPLGGSWIPTTPTDCTSVKWIPQTQLIGTPQDSVVLLGDLNATPAASEIRTLLETLVDAWEAAGLGDGYTYPVEDPHSRIDYVMQSDDVVVRTVAVVTTPLAASASDHLPVVADVALPGQKVGIGH